MPKYYSYTQLSTWEQCPLRYKLYYLENVRSVQESIETFMGRQVHFALKKLYKDLMHSKTPSLAQLIEGYEKQWEFDWETKKERILIVNKDYTPENFKVIGIRCIKHYWKRYYPFKDDITLGLERKIRIPLNEAYWIKGQIDRLSRRGDAIEIHDYKTSQYLPTYDRLTHELQLALYSIGVQQAWHFNKPIHCIWHYLVHDQELRLVQTLELGKQAKEKALGLINRIEVSTEFQAKESLLCDWCEYQPYCPKRKHLASLAEVSPEEYLKDEGVDLVNKWVKYWKMKEGSLQELSKVKAKILRYALQNGLENLTNDSYKIGIRWEFAPELPPKGGETYKQLLTLLKSSERWRDISKLDENALKDVIQNNKLPKELKEEVLRLAPIRKKGTLTRPLRISK
jgi:hypothetical protein